jgi:mRNA interferase MazF
LFEAGDVVVIDFPGVTGVKRRPAVVLSSNLYHQVRPDIVVGLLTSQTAAAIEETDCVLEDSADAGLRVASAFRSFFATLSPFANPVRIGRLSDRDWAAVSKRVRNALAPLESSESAVVENGK